MRTIDEVRQEVRGLEAARWKIRENDEKLAALVEQRAGLQARRAAGEDGPGLVEKVRNLDRGIERLEAHAEALAEIEAEAKERDEHMQKVVREELARPEGPRNLEQLGQGSWTTAVASSDPRQRDRDVALAVIGAYDGQMTARAADRLDDVVRNHDPHGLASRYVAAVGSPDYFSAFGKMLADPQAGHLRFNEREVEAVRRVGLIEAERGMVEGTGSAGGFGVPFQLDPTLMLTSDGTINPVREVARIIPVTTNIWKGVSTATVIGGYQAEAAEAADGTPTLAQPAVEVFMGRAFVPFSMELGDDWQGLAQELGRLISDGRDQVDSTAFLTGTGSDEPEGILTGLSGSQEVMTASIGTFAVGDPWLLKAAIPPRYAPRTSFLANPTTWDAAYRLVGTGDEAEPVQMEGRGGAFLGRPKYEWSAMDATVTAGDVLIVGGDFQAGYVIADRLGLSVEIVPHLFGSSNRFPTGQRGVFARWRTGAAVVDANAIRALVVKAS